MYSLDVNFLVDRPEYSSGEQGTEVPKKARQQAEMRPLILGMVAGILPLALVGGLLLFLQQQTGQLEEEQARVTQELERSNAQRAQVDQLTKQINATNEETQALATVFNQIKPWSAMLQDIRERVPPGVQIQTIEQTEAAANKASSNAANAQAANSDTRQPVKLEITGTARSFDDVNYFLLTLQRSSFFKGDQTQLVSADLVNNPTKLEVPKTQNQSGTQVKYELPKVVEYKIQTNLSNVPASELLRELDSKGAVGLVTRIKTLQQKGVIQQ
ncbi:PilN domain-containing protein [Lyngbya aestuarii]|uniref:PilN domain-containing protein n=1 Tax=Lyngbya aestuarii TaxID=118322 RepID=UPI00403D693B